MISKMCQLYLLSLLLFNVFAQRNEIAAPLTIMYSGLPQNADRSDKKLSDTTCDFTAYNPVRESHFVGRAVVKKHMPTYPPDAVSRSIQGRVNVKILINRNGDVERACAIDGAELLKNAAEKSALQWKFKPNFGASSSTKSGSRKYMFDVIGFNFVLDKTSKIKSDSATIVRP